MRFKLILVAIFSFTLFSTGAIATEDPDKYKLYKFTYQDADDCSCFVQPDICGGGFYMTSLQRRILHAWHPPDTTTDKEAVARFRVHRNGKLTDLKLVSKSDSPFAQSALQAIEDAAPFYPLPDGAPEDVDVQFTFPTEYKPPGRLRGFDSKEPPAEQKSVPYTSQFRPKLNYFQFRLAPYLMMLQKTIRDKWSESGAYKTHAIISFTMNAEGKLYDFSAAHSEIPSNQAMYDLVKQSSPIALPPGLPGEIRIKFAFELKNPYILEAQLLKL